MGRLNMPDVRKIPAAEERAMVTVELFQDFDDGWWWRARECKLMRGPFTSGSKPMTMLMSMRRY